MVLKLYLLLSIAVAHHAFAQTTPPPIPREVEPNETRVTATPLTLPHTGGGNGVQFLGLSRGFATTGTVETTRDLWRLTFTTDPNVIYQHTLTITTSGTSGHTGSIIGHQRTGDVIVDGVTTPGVEDFEALTVLQSSSISTTPPRSNVFYTLGQSSPSVLYRVIGTPSTTADYLVTHAKTAITPVNIDCPFAAGPITITTVGQGHTTNTELFLFDAATMQPIEDGLNDDSILTTGVVQSRLVRNLAAGSYILAIGTFDTADSRVPPVDDRARTQSVVYLTDTPGVLVNSSSQASAALTFAITDSLRTMATVANKPGPYGIAFYRFTLGQPKCNKADIGQTGGASGSDGLLNADDFVVFLDAFFNGTMEVADIGQTGGLAGADTILDNNDFVVYLDRFFRNCNCPI